jgi:hypothetical protein
MTKVKFGLAEGIKILIFVRKLLKNRLKVIVFNEKNKA